VIFTLGFVLSFYAFSFLTFIIYLLFVFFYRKKSYLKVVEDPCLQKCFNSPVNGTVISVDKSDGFEILIKTSFFDRADLVMPTNAEVINLQEDPQWIEFETPKLNHFSLHIRNRKIVRRLSFYLLTGDRARSGATMGFMLFGGEVLIKLGENYTIMVESGDVVKAGSSPLATMHE
jgi:hypothetical protein